MSIGTISQKNAGNIRSGEKVHVSFISSQLLLFHSRKKWGVLYSLATVTGLLVVPGVLGAMASEMEFLATMQRSLPLPVISFLIAVGMYILNDLVDADLDRANAKKRPIPSGLVSKKQAWSFILWTSGLAVLLAIVTFNPASVVIMALMITMGILYSAPRIALAEKFVIKTLSISFGIILCAMLGSTVGYGTDLAATGSNSLIAPIHAVAMVGIFIFITSTLNDLGDVAGDKAAGRRTVPIVLGGEKTVKLTIALAMCMPAASWIFYGLAGSLAGMITSMLVSCFAALVAVRMAKTLKGMSDMEFMRRQHKKLFPLHLVLQSFLIIGAFLP